MCFRHLESFRSGTSSASSLCRQFRGCAGSRGIANVRHSSSPSFACKDGKHCDEILRNYAKHTCRGADLCSVAPASLENSRNLLPGTLLDKFPGVGQPAAPGSPKVGRNRAKLGRIWLKFGRIRSKCGRLRSTEVHFISFRPRSRLRARAGKLILLHACEGGWNTGNQCGV